MNAPRLCKLREGCLVCKLREGCLAGIGQGSKVFVVNETHY
jgi:hypothetical protein